MKLITFIKISIFFYLRLDFDVFCEKDSSIGEISLNDFQKCLGGKFKDVVMQNEKHSEVFSKILIFLKNKMVEKKFLN